MLRPVAEFAAVPWNADNSPACTMSIRDMVLTDADGTNQIASITLLGPDFRPESVACATVQLELDNGQVIFFDPSYYFGIRTGGLEQRSIWLDNAPGALGIDEWASRPTGR